VTDYPPTRFCSTRAALANGVTRDARFVEQELPRVRKSLHDRMLEARDEVGMAEDSLFDTHDKKDAEGREHVPAGSSKGGQFGKGAGSSFSKAPMEARKKAVLNQIESKGFSEISGNAGKELIAAMREDGYKVESAGNGVVRVTAKKATPAPPSQRAAKVTMTPAQSKNNIAQLEKLSGVVAKKMSAIYERMEAAKPNSAEYKQAVREYEAAGQEPGAEVGYGNPGASEESQKKAMARVAAKDKERGFDWDKDCQRFNVIAPEDRSTWPAHCLRIPAKAKGPIYLGIYPESAFWGSYMPYNGGPRKPLYNPAYRIEGNSGKLARGRSLRKDEKAIDAALEKANADPSSIAFMYASAMWALAIRSGAKEGKSANKVDYETGEVEETNELTFGTLTMRGKHIRVRQGGVYIAMPGKKGSVIDLRVPDKFAKGYSNSDPKHPGLKEKAGSNGKVFGDHISYSALRKWMDSVKLGEGRALGDYIPHDVRMLRATNEAKRVIAGMKPPEGYVQWKMHFKAVKAAVGKVLTDTPGAFMSYIDPGVWKPWAKWQDKKTMEKIAKFWGGDDE